MDDIIKTIDEYFSADPEINPEWRDLIEPTLAAEEQKLLSYVLSYLFM